MPQRPPPPWAERWIRVDGPGFRGGQGVSFVARAKDGSGPMVFIKELHPRRVANLEARRRFKREVGAYEALAGLGPPRIFDHNADTWEDRRTPLYMATEFIDGINLRDYVETGHAVDLDAAFACVNELAIVLNRCHAADFTHRDLKPANVVLRDSDIRTPVLVDFGLSFNNAEEDDPLTRLNEEIGNRFLRLPEHRSGGRNPVSDVTQLAGIFFYIITGREPLILRDEHDVMPHRRPDARSILDDLLVEPRQRLRVASVLDSAFTTDLSGRYATAPDLISALERAMHSDQETGDSYEDLFAQVGEIVASQGVLAANEHRESLGRFLQNIVRIAADFGSSQGLDHNWNGSVGAPTDDVWQERRVAVIVPGENLNPTSWPLYRVERRGPDDFVVLIDGEELWRGESADDPEFTNTIKIAIAKQFLAAHPPARPDH